MNEAESADVSSTSFIGANSANIERYIEGSYVAAWQILSTVVPKSWLQNKSFHTSSVVANLPQGKGYVILPTDFYMLHSFKMVGWQKDVKDAPIETDAINMVQNNPYTQGSLVRPVATIGSEVINNNVGKVLNYYTVQKGLPTHVIEKAIYVPSPTPLTGISPSTAIEIDDRLIEPIAYICAACVFNIFQKTSLASSMTEMGMLMIPGYKPIKSTNVTAGK